MAPLGGPDHDVEIIDPSQGVLYRLEVSLMEGLKAAHEETDSHTFSNSPDGVGYLR